MLCAYRANVLQSATVVILPAIVGAIVRAGYERDSASEVLQGCPRAGPRRNLGRWGPGQAEAGATRREVIAIVLHLDLWQVKTGRTR